MLMEIAEFGNRFWVFPKGVPTPSSAADTTPAVRISTRFRSHAGLPSNTNWVLQLLPAVTADEGVGTTGPG